MDKDEQLFLTNVQGSAAANLMTGIFFLIIWVLKNKCKHSKCKSHTGCFTCSVKEDDDESCLEKGQRGGGFRRQETLKIPGKVKIRLHQLHEIKHDGLLQERQTAIPTD